MRTCTKCHQAKKESEYFMKDKRSGRLHTQCKSCYRELRKIHYAKHYEKYKEHYRQRAKQRRNRLKTIYRENMMNYLKNKACVDCGESDPVVLELDHINPKDKLFTISQAVRLGYSWSAVEAELSKCRIVCSNCHKKRTAHQFGWYKVV